jgi:hypothetical protein
MSATSFDAGSSEETEDRTLLAIRTDIALAADPSAYLVTGEKRHVLLLIAAKLSN